MADEQQILADDEHYLDEIPGPTMDGSGFALGSDAGREKLTALVSLIRSWVPEPDEHIGDPIQYIRKAIDDIVWGRGRPGVSLRELASRTEHQDPLRKALLALSYFRASMGDATSSARDEHMSVAKWPDGWRQMLSRASRDELSVRAHDGYFIDFYTLFAAESVLSAIQEECVARGDHRGLAISACRTLLDRCPMPFVGQIDEAYADDELLVLFDENNPGRFHLGSAEA